MQHWRSAFLGRRRLPRALSAFELEAFFTFTGAERRAIEQRRTAAHRLGLALQLGFLRMCGRPLAAVGAVPPALWRDLGAQFEVTAPDLASLRVMYRRLSTLYEHQELACQLLGFRERIDPRRQTPSVGIYTHVRDRWGISYVQPIVLNERQAGAAIEGVVRDDALATTQLATDTHGHTDVAMALARLLGFDLCPRLKALSDRHLFLPKGSDVPEAVRSIVRTRIDPAKIVAQWDRIVHLAASVHAGHASAVEALSRYGSAARGDPLYEALAQLGQLLRTVFLADYFVNDPFRRELLRVLNRGESVNALKRAIYSGRVATFQAKRHDELAAVGDALGLLANVVMAWNTAQMQAAFDRLNARKSTAVPPELIGRIAPTRTEGINLRGVFRFPVEAYAEKLLPSTPRKTAATGS